MKASAVVPIFVGLIAGMVALYFGLDQMKPAGGEANVTRVKVLVARVDIPHATQITKEMLGAPEIAEPIPFPGFHQDPDELIGRVTAGAITAGSPILDGMLAKKGTPPGAENQIADGHRLCTVKVKPHVVRLVEPGNFVDVLAMPAQRSAEDDLNLQYVEVFAVGNQRVGSEPDEDDPRDTITFSLPPTDAARLTTIASAGSYTIGLTLRRTGDDAIVELPKPEPPPVVIEPQPEPVKEVVAAAPPVVLERKKPEPPPPVVVEVFNGFRGKKEEYARPASEMEEAGPANDGTDNGGGGSDQQSQADLHAAGRDAVDG